MNKGGPDVSPKPGDIRRLLERRRAAEFGHELPLYASEAADYMGISLYALAELISAKEISTHARQCLGGKMSLFYVSELEEWLVTNANEGATNPSPTPTVINERTRT